MLNSKITSIGLWVNYQNRKMGTLGDSPTTALGSRLTIQQNVGLLDVTLKMVLGCV